MHHSMNSVLSSFQTAQCGAYQQLPQRSLRLTLCLNGTVPIRELLHAPSPQAWLESHLREYHPDVSPGKTGPIAIVLVL